MAIKVDQVSRVVIAGAWYSCQVGTFRIVPYEFHDENGKPVGGELGFAYEFRTIDRDFYTGPLAELQLIKLVPQ
jgi:hypothetical protein